MKSLEKKHIETIEMAIEKLRSSKIYHDELICRLNQLLGYLIAIEEFKNKEK